MDEQELNEREQAAQAYAGEDAEHFVEYCEECVREDLEATKEIRQVWDECWKAHQTQIDYADKEDWQAKVKLNDPFMTVQQAKAIIRKALLKANFYRIEGIGPEDTGYSELVKIALDFFFNPQHVDFPKIFPMACEMGLATGQSMEMIPSWNNSYGLKIPLVEPWKISRDPDAVPQDPWSGNYWVHTEWHDLWEIKEAKKQKMVDRQLIEEPAYINIENLKSEDKDDDEKKAEQRRQMYWKRSKFRHYVRVRDFWGVVLDKKGDLLMPAAHYMVGGDQVILAPERNKYETMKWPGVSFSPFVHLLRFHGIGLLQGVISLWWIICNLMNLDIDNFNWVINKMVEIDPSMMADPTDIARYPGKLTVRKAGAQGPIFNETMTTANTSDVLGRLQQWRQMYDNSSTVNQFVQGSPGTRSNITKGEVEIKTKQSLGIFDSIAKDIEIGAVDIIWAAYETIMLNWGMNSVPSIPKVLGDKYNEIKEAKIFEQMTDVQRRKLLQENADIKVSGISAELQQWEYLEKLQPFFDDLKLPQYAPYIKAYKLLVEKANLLGLHDPDWLLTEDEVKQMRQIQAMDIFNALPPEQQNVAITMIKDLMQGGMKA